MSKKNKIALFLLSALFILSIIGIIQRTACSRSVNIGEVSDEVEFNFHQRKQAKDQWFTSFPEFGSEKRNLYGRIYEATLQNLSPRIIDRWKLRIDITQECFINSAWNGSVEIHQFISGKEKIQKPVDLRTADMNELSVYNAMNNRGLIMVPLKPGDYLIYHPSSMDVPLEGFREKVTPAYTTFGFIFYNVSGQPVVSVAQGNIVYHLKNGYLEDSAFYVFLIISFILAFTILSILRSQHHQLSQDRDKKHDRQMIEQIMKIFTKFIDAKDPYTGGHSERVADIAKLLAEELGYSKEHCQNIYYCGLLHDCGKIAIGDQILQKPEKLTPDEYKIIQDHTIRGYDLLQELTTIPEAKDAARCHHERYDGTGYPYGLKGDDIPMVAKIITVADSFDTMNSDRYYRKALSRSVIIGQMEDCKNTQFDPKIVDAFMSLLAKGKIQFK